MHVDAPTAPKPPVAPSPAAQEPDAPSAPKVSRDQLAVAIGQWLATPAEYREHPDLRSLARSMGWSRPGSSLYDLAATPAALHGALAATVAGIVPRLPEVLEALYQAAVGGSVRAADALLRHVREVAQMSLETVSPVGAQHLHVHLEDTAGVARRLLETADAVLAGRTHSPVPVRATFCCTPGETMPTVTPATPGVRWTARAAAVAHPPPPGAPPGAPAGLPALSPVLETRGETRGGDTGGDGAGQTPGPGAA